VVVDRQGTAVSLIPARLRNFITDALDRPTPFVKQSATTVAVAIATVAVVFVPGIEVSNVPSFITGLALLVVATILAWMVTVDPRLERIIMMVPTIDVLAIAFFRAGTGAIESAFTAMLLLPVVWLASGNGRRFIVYVALSTAIVFMLPASLGLIATPTGQDLTRALFTTMVFTLAGGIINELSRQARRQVHSIKQLADDKERMLQRTVEYAAQLQESEAKYRAADRLFRGVWAAVTEQSVIGADTTGLIDAWNPGATKILGYEAEEVQDIMHIFDFHLEEELEDWARELNYPPGETVLNPGFSALVENARLGHAESREWTYRRRDGSQVPVMLSVTKRVNGDGETVGYLFVASDMTQAKEVSRLKDEFVGLISHELRTPLSSILGYLELMRDDEDDPLSEEHLQYLAVAERNAHRLLRLVGDLLFTAQVESGKFPLDTRDLELHTILDAAIETARPIADNAGIELVKVLPDERAVVHGDPVRLGQAVDNLMSNAIKFTPRGGKVTLALGVDERGAVITVRDTGMGIAESELDKLFSRFFRATTATRNAVPGVGLGLTITKAIVTAHHGLMGVESEEGVGTQFSVTLPLVAVPVPA
jgi:signal transduction histidine kinase